MEYMVIGELSAFGAALLWSFSPYIFTIIVKRSSSFMLNTSRLLISGIMMLITFFIFGINFVFTQHQFAFLVLSGIIGLVLGDTFLFKSLEEIGPRYTMLIMSSSPAIGAIIAYLAFHEVISPIGIAGMIITLSGIILVINQQPDEEVSKFQITRKGIIFGFFAAIGQGLGLIFTKLAYFEGDLNPLIATFLRIFSAFIILLPLGYITKRINIESIRLLFIGKTFLLLLVGSFIGSYLGITLSYIAIAHAPIGVASTIMSFQPILMLPISKIVHNEKHSWKSIIGALLAVLGIVLLFIRKEF